MNQLSLQKTKTKLLDIRSKFPECFFAPEDEDIQEGSIPLGIANWDYWLFGRRGGVPMSRITSLSGWEGCGKTTMGYHGLSAAQKHYPNRVVGFIDMENAGDPEYMKVLGVDVKKLEWAQPAHGTDACRLCQEWLKTGDFSFILFDSVAAAGSEEEMDKEVGSPRRFGDRASLWQDFFRKTRRYIRKYKTALFLLNQFYEAPRSYGPGTEWKEPASAAIKFYPDVRIWALNTPSVNKGEKDPLGGRTATSSIIRWETKKVRGCGKPLREAHTRFIFGKGVDKIHALLDAALRLGVAHSKGTRIEIPILDSKARYMVRWMHLLSEKTKTREKLLRAIQKASLEA